LILRQSRSGGRVRARYEDRFERRDGRWVIAERRIVLDALGPGRIGVDPAGVL
jgi:hypothetical protein